METTVYEAESSYIYRVNADGKQREFVYPKKINGETLDLLRYKNEVELLVASELTRTPPTEVELNI